MFWLSHHPPEQWNRTYCVRGTHLCARCLGAYPTAFVAIVAQLLLQAPLRWGGETALVLLLTLPALVDWARGQRDPTGGTNLGRTATGVLLGLALGRTLYVHLRDPWPPALRWQLAMITAVVVPVLVLASRRKRG